MPMKVAVDLDNTLADTTGVLIQLTNWKFNTNYTVADVDDWDFWRSKGPEMDAAFWKIYDFMETLYLRRVMPPVHPLACPVVKMLEKAGHQVSVLTANNDTTLQKFNPVAGDKPIEGVHWKKGPLFGLPTGATTLDSNGSFQTPRTARVSFVIRY